MTGRCAFPPRVHGGLLVLLLGALAVPAAAQPTRETVGRIEEMRRDRSPVDSTGAVRLTASPIYARKPAHRDDALHVRELVELLEPYYVRAHLAFGPTRTRFYAGSSGARIGDLELERRGAYEILPARVDTLSGLELRIRHGVVVLEHAAGRLDAWVSGTLMSIFGTTALLAADSTSAEALCFLQEGHIAFPEFGMDFRGRNVAWRLRAGLAPERIPLAVAELQAFRREVDLVSRGVWRGPRPFWQKPGFYLPVGAVLVGAGVLLLTSGDGGDGGRLSGDVLVLIPD